MRKSKQKGTILISLIVAILLIGVLGVGIYSLTTSSTFTGLLSNKNDQAYQLAQAGVRYAIDTIGQCRAIPNGTNFSLPDNNHVFAISVVNNVITSVGIVNAGTLAEAQRQITYGVPSSILINCANGQIITSQTGAFTPTIVGSSSAITVSTTSGTISLGGSANDSSGTFLYQGSSSVSNCNAGACNFPYGLRAYFEFTTTIQDNSSDSTGNGDGFTFGVFSAINNTRERSGGSPAGNSASMGELMGYAGPGNTTAAGTAVNKDSLGLKPPKMALEFDMYPNTGAETNYGCSGGRNDSANNHVALLFWGLNPSASTTCTVGTTAYPQASFDDNIHGAGTGDTSPTPVNSYSGYAGGGYYEGTKSAATTTCLTLTSPTTLCNWMEDGHKYGVRMEIARNTVGGTTGLYQIMAWIYRLDITGAPTGTQLTHFQDVQNPYSPYATIGPQILRTITLNQTDHAALNQVYFGFTEATGGATQNIQIANLQVFFPQTTTGTCIYSISPTTLAAAYGGVSGQTVAVTAGDNCTWTAVSNSTWITVTSGASGTGSGTVTYNVATNTGTARTGTMTIAGQTFTVTQANGCTYTFGTCPAAFPRAGGTGSISVTTPDTGCTWTSSDTVGWISTSPTSSNGTGSVTVTVSARDCGEYPKNRQCNSFGNNGNPHIHNLYNNRESLVIVFP